ncbi:MAG: UTP--glucose-1-phosphate uridylyltransferase [Lachnospiraceae bacterium]|nr:UTP--glucose-1-phosphate uridylyltransferase [Lachnospiraceae bacterium]
MTYEEAKAKLKVFGQEHLLHYYEELSENEKTALLEQISSLDFSYLKEFGKRSLPQSRGEISPIRAMREQDIAPQREKLSETGLQAIRDGRLCAVLLAGGMGTRLGFDGPKGTLDIGKTRSVFIFQRLIENLKEVTDAAGTAIRLFIMTSDKNGAETRSFFKKHDYFGYPEEKISFFVQDMAPVVDDAGKVLLETPGKIATSPNGNGGWFRSLAGAGFLDLLNREGIEWINVFSVDNVLQRIADPAFFGAVLESGFASGSKVIRKANREEKVGVMCLDDGKPSVIEYYEMTEELLDAKDENGEPAYNYGVILNYLFRIADLTEIMNSRMQIHFAHKAVSCLGPDGLPVIPDAPNAWKFELFILDLIHELSGCLPYEVVREKEFAPVKNKTGSDSILSAQALLEQNHITL